MPRTHELVEVSGLIEEVKLWLEKREINLFLFDLDGTLLDTQKVFDKKIKQAMLLFVAHSPGWDIDQARKRFNEIDFEEFRIFGVNPQRLRSTVSRLSSEHYLSCQVKEEMTKLIMEVYKTSPPFMEGTLAILGVLRQAGVQLGAVTHANKDWTDFKIDTSGLKHFFNKIFVVDENGVKDWHSWKEAISQFGVEPENVAVVGDSLKGDIISAGEAGVKHLFWLDSQSWDPYGKNKVPQNVRVIKRLTDVISTMVEEADLII